ncbi:MAG: TRAP transporter permease [Pseudolabrys sp.]
MQAKLKQSFVGAWTGPAWVISVACSLYYTYTATFGISHPSVDRSLFIYVGIALAICLQPLGRNIPLRVVDCILLALATWSTVHFNLHFEEYMANAGFDLGRLDLFLGAAIIVISIEAARRALGAAIPIIALVFLAYLFVGPWIPGALHHSGFSFEAVVSNLYASTEGLYGIITYTLASTLFLFLVFGQFLVRSGASTFYSNLCLSLLGKHPGGGAKAAVTSSMIVGSITGSAAANVAITGVITIPLMIRSGYRPHIAAGIEAAASTGGTVLPPVMGSAAFIMVALTGIPYSEIALYSAIPAVIYYLVVFLQVHFYAKRNNLKGLPPEECQPFLTVLRRGWAHFLPVIIIVMMVYWGYSLSRTALFAMIASVLCSWTDKSTRMGPAEIIQALADGTRHSLTIIAIAAPVSIMTLAMLMPGTGLKITSLLINLGGGHLAATIALIFIVGYVLGMGLSVVPSYIILATLAAPALMRLGIPIMAAHFVVMWWGQASNVTPPVALASYVAANIAKAPLWKSGNAAVIKGAGLFFLPILFVYQPGLLLTGSIVDIIVTIASIIGGVVLLAAAIEGYLIRSSSLCFRLTYAVMGSLLIVASEVSHVIALAIAAVALIAFDAWLSHRPAVPKVEAPFST